MKTLFTLAAVSALALAAPAAAQSNSNFDNRIDVLQRDIQIAAQANTIRRDDLRTLREHLRVLRQTERTYAINGFTRAERQDLQNRIQNLRQQIRYAANWRSNTRYGAGYGTTGFIDRNRDGWDDRDIDRDGRWDDNVNSRYGYGMGGPYDEETRVCGTRSSGILGGLLNTVMGRDNCLTVGERVGAGLSGLPYHLRDDFRDGNGYYHRYFDGRVIQIDARTNTVVRIFDVD